ncbi:SusC/RagA family TonB-linked outer membrane protein [Sphingobacterium lactis]|uniref:TonB-linked outer membrane protein, SusC/RagA family n=1 Tax=Sphingobacterium lactis TaxID=797291 RepID=A0A1H5Z600_9SPHI|nr:TonB-dependent receptor [Sphingobacterium lactis]SEG31057.1 TonB-linked outer membrane protein, SusC/RagA family [Sphingobacterium lactis]
MGKSMKFQGNPFSKRVLKNSLLISMGVLSLQTAIAAESTIWNRIATHPLYAIQTPVKGRIVDKATQQPIIGATIKVVGKTSSTSSDASGNFEIDAQANDVLEVTYVGFVTARYTVTSVTQNAVISLDEDSSNLEEVVVTGYGAQRKKDLTGAVAVVNVSELKSQPAGSAVEALQGRATGVQIVNDGAPGSTPQIRIRGYSTVRNNEPLYVIDGVPFEGKLSWLNQNDIESMQVLKDASAASIYGARANNGVVIITTKSGKEGRTTIAFDAYAGVGVPNKSTFPKMLTPQQVLDFDNRLNGTNLTLPEYLVAGGNSDHKITPEDLDMSKYNYFAKDRSGFYQITKANHAGTNWFNELSQNAPIQSYQLSASGGSETAQYAFSGGFLDQKGSLIHSGFRRYNVRNNAQFNAFNKKLRFGENVSYAYTEGFGMGVNPNTAGGYQGEGSVLGFAYRIQNIIPVYDEGGNFAGSWGEGHGNGQNPVAMAYRAKDNMNRSNFFFGNAFAEYDIIDGLTFRSNFGLRYENYNGVSYTYPNPEFSEGGFNNGMSEYHGFTTEWTWTNTVNYKPKLGEDHVLNIMLGTEAIKNRNRGIDGSRNGYFIMNSLDYLYLNAGSTNFNNNGSGSISSMFSLMGKVDYSYKDRYLLSLIGRRDGSSNFGVNNLYGVFPGISGAWRISQEEFAQGAEWLTDLKLRAGYGVTGNQSIPAFQYLNRYVSSLTQSSYPMNSTAINGIWQSDYANPDIKWEQVKSVNVGLDFTVLNGDLDGSIDWFNKTTTDMLFLVPLPAAAVGRAASPYQNIGDMSNKGIEFSLGYHYGQRQEKPFTLDLSASFSRYVNKVVSLAPTIDHVNYGVFRSMETSILQKGQPFGSFYGYQVAGIYQSEDDVANSPSYENARPGGLKYADLNNNGEIDPGDRTIIGNPHPDFVYSLNINANYKNFDLLMFFYGSQGNDLYEATRYFTDFGVFKGQKSARLLNEWSPTNTGSDIPSLPSPEQNPSAMEYVTSSYYIQDGSFLKLKNLQLGYNLPTQKIFGENTSFNRLRVYLGVTNVFTITKYEGLDPEVSATPSDYPALGVDFGVYPQARQYTFGLSLGF